VTDDSVKAEVRLRKEGEQLLLEFGPQQGLAKALEIIEWHKGELRRLSKVATDALEELAKIRSLKPEDSK